MSDSPGPPGPSAPEPDASESAPPGPSARAVPTSEIVEAEIVPDLLPDPPPVPAPDYDERGVPGFDYVRDKIEGRYATSIGGAELAAQTPQGRTLEEREAEHEKAARAKLDEIRRSLER